MKQIISKHSKKINLKRKNTYRKKVSIFLLCIVVLLGIIITSSVLIFSKNDNTKATYIAYVYDGETHDAPPAKGEGYVIDEVKCEKTKGAWNNDTWELVLAEMEGNFSCSLKFKMMYPYYKLSVNPNGGSYNESPGTYEVYVLQGFTFNVKEPTRVGYTFDGWEVIGKESSIKDQVFKMGKENTELKAKWKVNTYAVEIMGSVLCDGLRQVDYQTATELCTPEKEGYTFTGWEITSGRLEGNNFIVDAQDAIITAKWQINNYDYITYHMQQAINGSYVLKDVDVTNATYNTEVSPEVRTYTGFTSPARKTIRITVRDNEINYRYTRNKYTLTITPGTGVTYSGSTSMQLYFEETTELAIPVKTGYNFTGWTKTSGEVTDNIFKMGSENATLTTNWSPKKFNVTFDGNGGSITQTTKEVTYDSTYGELPEAIRNGYNFLGWYTAASGGSQVTPTTAVKITDNQTLYAHWQIKTYTITYNANGGSVSPTSTSVTHGSSISSLPTPTRSSYTFLGWYTASSGGTKITTSTTFTSAQTIYAHWVVSATDFGYTGSVQTFTAPVTGTYKLEVWGAQGGGSYGGLGGYSVGNMRLTGGTSYYVYVGGQGTLSQNSSTLGGNGYNGGGLAYYAYGGGGMTHISKVNTDNLKPSAYTETITLASYPASTTNVTVTYQGKTAGSSWNSSDNKNWTFVQQFTATGSSSITFKSTSNDACPNCTYDPTCRITVNGTIAVQDDDSGTGGDSNTNSYNFLCVTNVNSGDRVTLEVSSYRESGGTVPATISLPARVDQQTLIRYSESGSFHPSSVLILAGGGGGSTSSTISGGGTGGGSSGGSTKVEGSSYSTYSGTQSSGFKQGLGASSTVLTSSAGAGGGWYGGKVSNNTNGGAGGGSGYLSSSLSSASTTAGQRSGNGAARITIITPE